MERVLLGDCTSISNFPLGLNLLLSATLVTTSHTWQQNSRNHLRLLLLCKAPSMSRDFPWALLLVELHIPLLPSPPYAPVCLGQAPYKIVGLLCLWRTNTIKLFNDELPVFLLMFISDLYCSWHCKCVSDCGSYFGKISNQKFLPGNPYWKMKKFHCQIMLSSHDHLLG